jgi:peptide methionine sulfoxide reductase msrA/msrB
VKIIATCVAALVGLAACNPTDSPTQSATSSPSAAAAPADLRSAYFAGGCFWGVEHYMQQLDGVVSVESGYMGGDVDAPTYEQVSSHETGHLEAVVVRYDPARVDFEALAKRFFEIHDPTQANGQGPDIGPQYLSAVFVGSPEEEATTRKLIAQLEQRGYDVVTEIRPAAKFWPAEGYHQDYYAKTGKTPYCHARVRRFGD